ncbi:MAG TPA: tRNA (adenosine(37)-N6)-threonylcarbamoyltransferase complex dimerization subunit type 1 TsaB [Candidatus Binatus sp.]|nr:tRNA (adenosine(37)-N6)-threonylcarbamoyltransferase complex dimerization subunit type 1 TsaB [Candidatus Binatus sp.]
MRVLGIDTATPIASVALVENEKLIAEDFHAPVTTDRREFPVQSKGNHAEIIVPLIQALLERTQITLGDLSGLAISIGPGSFTGLRIALATVKGMAYESGLPVIGVSTLHANAARVSDAEGVVCSMLDARKQEVYAACFRRRDQSLTRLCADQCCSIYTAIDMMREHGIAGGIAIGDGAKVYEKLLVDAFGAELRLSAGREYSTIAAHVAMLSLARLADSSADDIGALSPLYLRPSEAEKKRTNSTLTC